MLSLRVVFRCCCSQFICFVGYVAVCVVLFIVAVAVAGCCTVFVAVLAVLLRCCLCAYRTR